MLRIRLNSNDMTSIEAIKKSKHLKNKDIADRLGVKAQQWFIWKTGEASMSLEKFQKLEEILGENLDHLGKRFESNYIGNSKTKLNP